MVQFLYLFEVFILAHYGPPSTETPTTETTIVWCHKNSWIYLTSTYLLLVTFETNDNYSIWFEISNNSSAIRFVLKWKTLFAQHYLECIWLRFLGASIINFLNKMSCINPRFTYLLTWLWCCGNVGAVFRLRCIHRPCCLLLRQSVDRDSLAGSCRFLGILRRSHSLPRLLISLPYRLLPLGTSRLHIWKVCGICRICVHFLSPAQWGWYCFT